MREIKFRGKRVDNGEWVYGDLIHRYSNWIYIAPIPSTIEITPIEIDPETVGQYTGLKDKNGKEIYEDDIVRVITDKKCVIGEVVYIPTAFCVKAKGFEIFSLGFLNNWFEIEVLGNIYENPELLKEVKE
jgi:uncharacterized phage protein (TIGR01671 family)